MKRSDRKPRSNSVLKTLPEEDQAKVFSLLKQKSLADVVVACREMGIKTSTRALSTFWSWYQAGLNFQNYAGLVEQVEDQLKRDLPGVTEDQLFLAGQKIFTALAVHNQDPAAWARVNDIVIKRQSIALDERRLKLLEEKAAKADKAQDVEQSELSDAEKLARYKQIFGINN